MQNQDCAQCYRTNAVVHLIVYCQLKMTFFALFLRSGKLLSRYYNITYWPIWYIGKFNFIEDIF